MDDGISVELIHGGRMLIDRDRGMPRGTAPPTPPGNTDPYRGGSTELGHHEQ